MLAWQLQGVVCEGACHLSWGNLLVLVFVSVLNLHSVAWLICVSLLISSLQVFGCLWDGGHISGKFDGRAGARPRGYRSNCVECSVQLQVNGHQGGSCRAAVGHAWDTWVKFL